MLFWLKFKQLLYSLGCHKCILVTFPEIVFTQRFVHAVIKNFTFSIKYWVWKIRRVKKGWQIHSDVLNSDMILHVLRICLSLLLWTFHNGNCTQTCCQICKSERMGTDIGTFYLRCEWVRSILLEGKHIGESETLGRVIHVQVKGFWCK